MLTWDKTSHCLKLSVYFYALGLQNRDLCLYDIVSYSINWLAVNFVGSRCLNPIMEWCKIMKIEKFSTWSIWNIHIGILLLWGYILVFCCFENPSPGNYLRLFNDTKWVEMAELTCKFSLCSLRYLIISCVWSEVVEGALSLCKWVTPTQKCCFICGEGWNSLTLCKYDKSYYFCGIRTVLAQLSGLTLWRSASAAFNLHTEQ